MGLKALLPRGSGLVLRRAWFTGWDVLDWCRGRRPPLVPPRRLSFRYGGGDFRTLGEQLREAAIEAGLTPGMRVLDVGCGIGRFALRIADYLEPSTGGSYDGFDIIRAGIVWAQTNVSAEYPNFRFTHVDLFNPEYNPGGRLDSRTFSFPFAGGSFDFVFLSSVFTHLLPDEVEHYLDEIARTTRAGGRTCITWFLRNAESRAATASGRAAPDFRHDLGRYAVMDAEHPERAVAYDEDWVQELYSSRGFRIVAPVRYGGWSGRPDGNRLGQDVVVAERL